MTRLLAAALLLIIGSAPAFACQWHQSVSTDTRSSTVASQQDNDPATAPPSSSAADHAPS